MVEHVTGKRAILVLVYNAHPKFVWKSGKIVRLVFENLD